MMSRTHDVTRIGHVMLALTALLAVAFGLVSGVGAAASATLGGIVAALNLHLLRAAVSRLIAAPRRPAVGVAAAFAKLILIVLLTAAAFSQLPLEPIPFALGISVLLAAVLLETLLLGTPVEDQGSRERRAPTPR